ncbi:hypothetical protein D3C73_1154480 [compost metagenome]
MQVNLPVHQPAGNQEFFDRVNTFFFNYQVIIVNVKHFNNAVEADYPFAYTGKEAVAVQIIHPV